MVLWHHPVRLENTSHGMRFHVHIICYFLAAISANNNYHFWNLEECQVDFSKLLLTWKVVLRGCCKCWALPEGSSIFKTFVWWPAMEIGFLAPRGSVLSGAPSSTCLCLRRSLWNKQWLLKDSFDGGCYSACIPIFLCANAMTNVHHQWDLLTPEKK